MKSLSERRICHRRFVGKVGPKSFTGERSFRTDTCLSLGTEANSVTLRIIQSSNGFFENHNGRLPISILLETLPLGRKATLLETIPFLQAALPDVVASTSSPKTRPSTHQQSSDSTFLRGSGRGTIERGVYQWATSCCAEPEDNNFSFPRTYCPPTSLERPDHC